MTATITRLERAVHSDYTVTGGVMDIALIYVPAHERGKGLGSAELARLLRLADEAGMEAVLEADATFGADLRRLMSWYTRYGFHVTEVVTGSRVRMVRPAR